MSNFRDFYQKHRFTIFIVLSIILVCGLTATIELWTGRSPLGPDGMFGWWDGNIWGSENSQRVADVYSLSHIIHGILFYAFFAWIARVVKRKPKLARFHRFCGLEYIFLASITLEAGWELLENSPIIINRYREATIAQGYVGDSVLNSVCDVGMVMIGFIIARASAIYRKVWISIAIIIVFELAALWWVRDNLTLNVLMLVAPLQSVKTWQAELAPVIHTTDSIPTQ